MAENLLPCPFCGSERIASERALYGHGHIIGCEECSANVMSAVEPPLNSERDARDLWNRRAALAKAREDARAIEAALDQFDRNTDQVPVGHEDTTKGASTYNWRRSAIAEIRGYIARAALAPEDDQDRAVKARDLLAAAPTVSDEWVMVPRRATRGWASTMANQRQGQRSTPLCEPPGEYEIQWSFDRITEVLAAAPAPTRAEVLERGEKKARALASVQGRPPSVSG